MEMSACSAAATHFFLHRIQVSQEQEKSVPLYPSSEGSLLKTAYITHCKKSQFIGTSIENGHDDFCFLSDCVM